MCSDWGKLTLYLIIRYSFFSFFLSFASQGTQHLQPYNTNHATEFIFNIFFIFKLNCKQVEQRGSCQSKTDVGLIFLSWWPFVFLRSSDISKTYLFFLFWGLFGCCSFAAAQNGEQKIHRNGSSHDGPWNHKYTWAPNFYKNAPAIWEKSTETTFWISHKYTMQIWRHYP